MVPPVAALDSTLGQFAADFVLLALVAVNGYLGWRLGLTRRIVAFAGLYVGVLAATQIGNGLASIVSPHSLYANAWMFVGVVAFIVLIFEGLGWAFEERLQKLLVFVFDRIAGIIAGVLVGVSQALVLFIVALAVAAVPANASNNVPPARGGTAHDITQSTLAGQVVRIAPQAQTVFSPVLPSNLSTHLVDGTQVAQIPGF
ncbi:MAG: CvpA family protein [Candidatus Dormibacteraeota bacterium]|nr:CvpA family protein [Candidatus Dormibacteraeota bacterium]